MRLVLSRRLTRKGRSVVARIASEGEVRPSETGRKLHFALSKIRIRIYSICHLPITTAWSDVPNKEMSRVWGHPARDEVEGGMDGAWKDAVLIVGMDRAQHYHPQGAITASTKVLPT